jgi:NADPH2:quinone reductase
MGISIDEGKTTGAQTPNSMRALELRDYDGRPESLAVVEKPVPRPRAGEVLVRISAAPINPSDLAFVQGLYGIKKALPVVPGFEAGGRVVAAGGGFLARTLVGKRVACAAPADSDGTWAEYMVTQAALCIPLIKEITEEQGATTIVNPLTAWALMNIARKARARAVVQTAAASALGQMVESLGRRFRLPVINIVRRAEQTELLKARGAQHILDSSSEDFDNRLRELCKELNATVGFDAVAGELTGRVLGAMSSGARIIVYGALSGEGCMIDPRSIIFEGKQVEGFWLSKWLRSQAMWKMLRTTRRVQRLIASDLRTEIRARLSLEEAPEGIQEYARHMTGGKILFIPGLKKEG